ncbi:MAG: cell filamentation protein Fic [Bacteroidetes bacterium GWF2_42_66]|nr:MAG: cell filamentation protein Fic [Bacteroidetes bacterium GWA2_42_15]OFX99254.1 MAG: cell filamentation protein Fic [Bacteroidetes bacterium GWE2_42_39]OFY40651.1 MAG: cell filamentation protein Fic [Bacteroidetes bacterium GWF2_42_66]HBL74501.1 cell filamentation protein Fic [Prolixibacteraceae bacterium]HCR91240.1 cell filamentation protein Fic [Prolixibacteraceae bacterium]
MMEKRESEIIEFIKKAGESSSKEIFEGLSTGDSYATVKRTLTRLLTENLLDTKGKGKGTKYIISPIYELIRPIDIQMYYEKEIDEREIKENFNFKIITEVLNKHSVFYEGELIMLAGLQNTYKRNISSLTENEYKKELERLAIDLSWKSSQIEGNTYSLLETEKLLKEKQTASGKTKEEAIMLLNHKEALDFIIDNPDYLNPLSVSKIEDIHSILVKELVVERNIRKRRVGISGTNYRPLDNEFQILEALTNTCDLINRKENVFEKALLALVLISYIQPFVDGNKRTARIVSNAILMDNNYCPVSFRTVDSINYKKAMLLFYEQNNISNFKEIFINQFEFAVNTYF